MRRNYDPQATWDGSNWYGGSLKTVENIGRRKAMSLVGCDLLGVNAFLVAKAEVTGGLFRGPFTAENHYETPKYHLTAHVGHPPSKKPRRWTVRNEQSLSCRRHDGGGPVHHAASDPVAGLRLPACEQVIVLADAGVFAEEGLPVRGGPLVLVGRRRVS